MARKKSQPSNGMIAFTIIGLLVVGGISFSTSYFLLGQTTENDTNNSSARNDAELYEEEKENKDDVDKYGYGDNLKDELNQNGNQPSLSTDEDGRKIATVQINFAAEEDNKIIARGEATNIVERTGICTYTFTSPSGVSKTEITDSLPAPSNTPCMTATIDATESGTWTVVLQYKSETSIGKSSTFEFSVR